jgi:hypothetical protein
VGSQVTNALVTEGSHTITCTVTDSGGATGSASVDITVLGNQAPVATITLPADLSVHATGDTVNFVGSATDAEDGALSGASLIWMDGATQIGTGSTVGTAFAAGDHVITLMATDAAGAVGIDTITITVTDNPPPVCVVSSPNDGDTVTEGESVDFQVTCTDPDGMPVANADIVWTSDQGDAVGVGANVTNALVTVGTHIITVCAKDPADAMVEGCTSFSLDVVANDPPVVTINAPNDSDVFQACEQIQLDCSAVDMVDGIDTIVWTDSQEGQVGTQGDLNFTPNTSGAHVLTCTATDNAGKSATAQVTITVESPTVSILHPGNAEVRALGDDIPFVADACDAEDGTLVGAAVEWFSNLEGVAAFATGANPTVNTLQAGTHTITVIATDSANNVAADTIQLVVNSAPVVVITSPDPAAAVDPDRTFLTTDTVNLTGTATDAEDGALLGSWVDNSLGEFQASQNTASLMNLIPGKHEITFSATDSAGITSSDVLEIFVEEAGVDLFDNFAQPSRVNAVMVDPGDGNLWLATDNDGLIKIDATTGAEIGRFDTNSNAFPDNQVNAMGVMIGDPYDGLLIVATDAGLSVGCDPSTWDCAQDYAQGDLQLSADAISSVVVLPDGRTRASTGNSATAMGVMMDLQPIRFNSWCSTKTAAMSGLPPMPVYR